MAWSPAPADVALLAAWVGEEGGEDDTPASLARAVIVAGLRESRVSQGRAETASDRDQHGKVKATSA
jgi:hypothetical protein